MSILCVLALLLGIVSLGAFLTPIAVVFALAAVAVNIVVISTIRRSNGELAGAACPRIGLLLALIAVPGGVVLHIYHHRLEVPAGYRQISFEHDIKSQRATLVDGKVVPDPDVEKLIGTLICLRGYMIPSRDTTEFGTFLLTPSTPLGYFGTQYNANEIISVSLRHGQFIDFTGDMISVAGELTTVETSSLESVPFYTLKNAEVRPVTSRLIGLLSPH